MKLASSGSSAEVHTSGGYISSLILDGIDILSPGNMDHKTHGGCAILFPFPNRIKSGTYEWNSKRYHLKLNDGPNAIHGLVNSIELEVESQSESSLALTGKLSDSGYPSDLDLTLTYSLKRDSLGFSLKARNTGKSSCPVAFGMHPYFLHGGAWQIEDEKTFRFLEYADGSFPDGNYKIVDPVEMNSMSGKTFDNCFELPGSITLGTRDYSIMISGNMNRYYVIYNGRWAGNKSVALEPMSAAPDSYNNGLGLFTLESGNDVEFMETFRIVKKGNNPCAPSYLHPE